MSECRVFSLDSIRTDGWFERIGESVGSFEALCEILGEQFFAFSLITGARITALNVDRQDPAGSIVEFEVGGAGGEPLETRKLTLQAFRQRLVAALVAEEGQAPAPERDTDTEAIQMHVGVRYLLLAPIFGYALFSLRCFPTYSELQLSRDGQEREFELDEFQELLRSHVLEELDRVENSDPSDQGGIDLAKVPEAEKAAENGEYTKVLQLLGPWAAPLSILLRTPDGRMLAAETRAILANALGVLGGALVELGDIQQAEEIMRLAVQYAVDTEGAGRAYARLGDYLLVQGRPAEAIAPLRRAANTDADAADVWPALSVAFLERGRLLAALGAIQVAKREGVDDPRLGAVHAQLLKKLPLLEAWQQLVEPTE